MAVAEKHGVRRRYTISVADPTIAADRLCEVFGIAPPCALRVSVIRGQTTKLR
jgi:hypothetical protein